MNTKRKTKVEAVLPSFEHGEPFENYDIDKMINYLTEAKELGATHYSFEIGYDMHYVDIETLRLSLESEEEYQERLRVRAEYEEANKKLQEQREYEMYQKLKDKYGDRNG